MKSNLSEPFSGFVIAVPSGDYLMQWVEENCPENVSEAEFFRFLCTVGMQFMKQSMERLCTDSTGVLDYVGYDRH
jgi:hypothetical protein